MRERERENLETKKTIFFPEHPDETHCILSRGILENDVHEKQLENIILYLIIKF